jgi:hypothetical protein
MNRAIVAVLAIHFDTPAREAITRLTCERLLWQTVPINVVVVGDSDAEYRMAKETGCLYVQHKNLPLSEKYQAGIDYARKLNPLAIVTTGSDSWLTDDYCRIGYDYMMRNHLDVTGKSVFNVLNVETGEVIARGYQGSRASEPDGNGRMITAAGMDKLNWKLYPDGGNVNGIDHASHQICLKAGLHVGLMNEIEKVKVLELKSSRWHSTNSFQTLSTAASLAHGYEISDGRTWMNHWFPGGLAGLYVLNHG